MARIHITGGPGTGKTTLARKLGERLNVGVLELDGQGLVHTPGDGGVINFEALARAREAESTAFAAGDCWLSEGSNVLVAGPLFERAEVVVVLYALWRVAGYRILMRHFKATLRGNNRFPGLRNLYRFWRWSSRYYRGTNPAGLNEWGTPNTQLTLEQFLQPYEHKVVRCRKKTEIEAVLQSLTGGRHSGEVTRSD